MISILYTPLGQMEMQEEQLKIKKLVFSARNDCLLCNTELALKTQNQLDEYFKGERKLFDLPIILSGTEFQIKVWENIAKVKYSETITYKQLAQITGNAQAARAVGGAANKNPVHIIIPCHRIVGSGNIGGYAKGTEIKIKLLSLEKEKGV